MQLAISKSRFLSGIGRHLVEGADDAEAIFAGGDVEVDLGGGDVFVTEEILDGWCGWIDD